MIVKMVIEYSEIDRPHRAAARRLGERATMLRAKRERHKKPTCEKSRQNREQGRERLASSATELEPTKGVTIDLELLHRSAVQREVQPFRR